MTLPGPGDRATVSGHAGRRSIAQIAGEADRVCFATGNGIVDEYNIIRHVCNLEAAE